ncbi:hypothetical protein FOL47_007099 [Perkinsus chesapeaki]|uniref:E3 ubiquitin-protein ligase HACE1 n=1 Tax=Perkinsus chesapeaki TaxID=330153 RepID=A0A7J6LN49_PERCH|nr:hypothetical protein FOL47_007099 [Perkinsus chesapeaki]
MSDPKTPLRKSLRLAGRKRPTAAAAAASSSSSESARMVTPAKPVKARQTATPSTKATTPKGPPESPFFKRRLKRQTALGQSFEDETDSDEEARTAERSESRARKRLRFQTGVLAEDGESSSSTEEEGQSVEESSEDSEPVMNTKAQRRAERIKMQREHEKKLTRQLFVMRSAVIEEEEEDSEGEEEEGRRPPRVDTGYPRLIQSTLFDTSSVEGSDDDDADSIEGFVVGDNVVDEEVSPTPVQVEGPASIEDLPTWHWTVPRHWRVWFGKEEGTGDGKEEGTAKEIERCIMATGRSHRKWTPSSTLRNIMDEGFDLSGEAWAELSPADLTAPQGPLRRSVLHALAMRDCQSASSVFKALRGSCTQVASARSKDKFGLTPLHLAAINPTFDAQGIRDLLAVVSPKLQFETDKAFSATALHLSLLRPDAAVAAGFLAGVGGKDRRRLLKARGFAERRSAVLIAALEKSVEKLSILRPADYQELDKQGLSALHLAAGSPDAIGYLIEYGNCGYNCAAKDTGVTPLHMAAVEGSAAGVQELLDLGADAGKCDNCGWSPLLYALQCVDSEDAGADAVEVLLRHDMTQEAFPQLSAIEALLKKDPGRAQPRVARLLRFVCERPAFFKMLNDFLRSRLELMLPGGPLAFILRARSAEPFAAALDMENKMRLLEMSVRRDKPSFVAVMKFICLRGPHFLQETIKRVLTFETSQMRWGHFTVSWYNERGSCLGPEREMWTCIFDELPDFAFERSDDGRLLLPKLDVELDVFVGIGRLIALAMVHGIGMKLPLHKAVVETLKMSDPFEPPQMDDLWEWLRVWSPSFYGSMEYLRDNDLTGLEEELCLPCGEDNKEDYILIELCRKVYRPGPAAAMKRGIRDVLKSHELKLFSSDELAVIFHSAGDKPLDLDDWKAHTHYTGYDESSPQIVWFWKLLRSLSDGEVRLVLLFATGLTSVPVGGFAQLRSLGSASNGFRVVRTSVGNPSCPDLPRASTCFNQLTLPAYDSEKMLNMKLMTAARLGSKGFEFS